MKIQNSKEPLLESGFFQLHDNNWLEKQRLAGKAAAAAISWLQEQVDKKTSLSTLELSKGAEEVISKFDCIPTFKGYHGFPEAVCISVNKELTHGIPKEYFLQEGDVVSFDLGATYQGAITDTAVTCIFGKPKSDQHVKMIEINYAALLKSIEAIKVDERLGIIGYTIHKYVKDKGFQVITNYGGHGLGWNTPHAPPFVANKASLSEGCRLQKGMSLAIEPMIVPYSNRTYVGPDKWTVMTDDIGVHHEHSIFIHDDHVEIVTERS
jgi:methionyl aminopeptidase